jgi:D-lyxose ketol-isomerase
LIGRRTGESGLNADDEPDRARALAREYLDRAAIVLTPEEAARLEITDFGLGRFHEVGLQLLVYVNTDRYCAKELVLLPRQICAEHRHPPVGGEPGKEETLRCRWGEAYLYVEGEATADPRATVPPGHGPFLTVWHEVILRPGEQWTVPPNTRHWFQSGDDGAVISEFSTTSRDEFDVFTDPAIDRLARMPGT